jgi:DNA ligase-1
MREFARLCQKLWESDRSSEKVDAMAAYFKRATPRDAAWTLRLLMSHTGRRPVKSRRLVAWMAEMADIPEWLVEESCSATGDIADTISLLPFGDPAEEDSVPLHRWLEERLPGLAGIPEHVQRERVQSDWKQLSGDERYLWTKLMTGTFRAGVSPEAVVRALSRATDVPEAVIVQRLVGEWSPTEAFYVELTQSHEAFEGLGRPLPFCSANPLDHDLNSLGKTSEWLAEWMWGGIRTQLVRQGRASAIWSEDDELLNLRFPEVQEACDHLPEGVILDGEILAWRDGAPLSSADLQRRLINVANSKLRRECPVVFMAFDLLQSQGVDLRGWPLLERRERLAALVADLGLPQIMLAPVLSSGNWHEWRVAGAQARERHALGLVLKPLDSRYTGTKPSPWRTWKCKPLTIDAVLIYGERGQGQRAPVYTFGVWEDDELVPIAKTSAGLTPAEVVEVEAFIKRNTLERFGPVRTVKPALVMEIAFDDIRISSRHKSGFSVQGPRIVKWRRDKTAFEADSLRRMKGGE